MSNLFGGMMVFLAILSALPAWAIDVVIAPGATARVESTNVISVSPVNVGANPLVAPGNYVVRFQWDPLENILVPISAVPAVPGNVVGQEINGVVIEAESLVQYDDSSECWLRVRVRNRSGAAKDVRFNFEAFDAAGRSIGYTQEGYAGGVSGVYPYDTVEIRSRWWAFGWLTGALTCDRIARYEIDLYRSHVIPYPR